MKYLTIFFLLLAFTSWGQVEYYQDNETFALETDASMREGRRKFEKFTNARTVRGNVVQSTRTENLQVPNVPYDLNMSAIYDYAISIDFEGYIMEYQQNGNVESLGQFTQRVNKGELVDKLILPTINQGNTVILDPKFGKKL